ncbi:MAG: hypothetical protein ACI4QT_07110 [Kiritimatiellia bacterium]
MPNPENIVAAEIAGKQLLPTDMSSAEIRDRIPAGIRERAIFSARTTEVRYLAEVQAVLEDITSGKINQADGRARLQAKLDEIGYNPDERGDTGIQNLASRSRIDLVLRTNRAMAVGATQARGTPVERSLYPAWRLERYEGRRVPRQDWARRWRDAANSVGFEGVAKVDEMIARKDSPVWAALGAGVGGYDDAIGNAYPPFAFNSGLAWTPVSADDAERLGIGGASEEVDATLSPGEDEIADALGDLGDDFAADLLEEL